MLEKLGFGLAVTFICMAIVFLVLITLIFIIKAQRAIVEKLEGTDGKKPEPKAQQPQPVIAQEVKDEEDDELVAVISAAVAAALGRSVSSIKVRSITAVPSWSAAGRQDQISSRF